ncbi:Crp/Fnr family transcriptional regulator [Microvirga lenta]|uniref:Crp/Fnr family transcriptional regulator n=1 Tax=Microvirga lenta TaxID=2881337 RepID=UPI001CFFB81E|nr:Crp/Fnr family transcriptional regulator [Microvirga lenta]
MLQPSVSNRLLAALPPEELQWILPFLEPVDLKQGQVLHWRALPITHVYFIEHGLVSVLAHTDEKEVVEVWLIGQEGLAGIPVLLGAESSPHRRVVQVAGTALRMRAEDLRTAMDQRPAIRRLLLKYVQAVLVQTSQSGACAKRHTLQQRVARWLLSAGYRLGATEIPLTHAVLSRLIGVRRASITVCLGELEEAATIRQSRGSITIADQDKLESLACDCYRIIRMSYDSIGQR